jgi:histidinol phosphatase-like enzyme (inositol monophosphatase family)
LVANKAREVTLDLFGTPLEASVKSDGTQVTIADHRAEGAMVAAIKEAFPIDAIFGEETHHHAGTTEFRWVLDPIDGTVSFLHGVGLWTTLIAIEIDGTPVAGIIDAPALGERVWGGVGIEPIWSLDGGDPRTCSVSTVSTLSEAMIATTSFDYFRQEGLEEAYVALGNAAGSTRGWSDAYAHLLLATGRVDGVVEPLLSRWDIAAAIPIIEALGGRHSDFAGGGDAGSRQGILSNGVIHDELVNVLRPAAR